MYKLIFASVFVYFGLVNSPQTTEKKVISIGPEKSFQNYEHFKRLVLNSSDSEAEYIENFEYEWGYHYKVKVEETKLGSTLSDGTRFEYKFIDIVSKEKVTVDYEFIMFLDPSVYYSNETLDGEEEVDGKTLSIVNDSTYLYFNEVEIIVPTDLKNAFLLIYEGKSEKRGKFLHLEGNKIKLKSLF